MSRRPLRIATTNQLESSARTAGFDVYLLPELPSLDFNRTLEERVRDGDVYRPFLEQQDIELVIDFNTSALTLVASPQNPKEVSLTTASLGIPYVSCYLDPITSTMARVSWADHWQLLESASWIKGVWETAHAEELMKLGVPNVIRVPIAAGDFEVNTDPLPDPGDGPVIAFMGHPASSWFKAQQTISSNQCFAGLTAAAVRADMPDLPFHKVFYDLYEFAEPPKPTDNPTTRAEKARHYYAEKFIYNAYLAIKQRDRFARFLKLKLGDAFELVGDHWDTTYGLAHTPRIWDMSALYERIRQVPVCLNLMKGCLESGLNLRHFEITAVGGFMLTYPSDELSSCFEVGQECEVFHNETELLEKVSYYLHHPDERREIALAGQRRTLAEHRYSHRITKLVELLREQGILAQTVTRKPPASPAVTGVAEST